MSNFIVNSHGRLLENGVGDAVLREKVQIYHSQHPEESMRAIGNEISCAHSFVWKVISPKSKSTETATVGRKKGCPKLNEAQKILLQQLIDEKPCTSIKRLRHEWKNKYGTDLPVNDATLRRFEGRFENSPQSRRIRSSKQMESRKRRIL